jgi:DNA-binding LytR/AlgR family response regulator
VLVVDDEELARTRLVRLLAKLPGVVVVGEAGDGARALSLTAALRPDVLLLDIEMPGLDGLAVAEHEHLPPVVFTTAHPEFAVDAFELAAVDYLVKPVRADRLAQALERVRARSLRAGEAGACECRIAVHDQGTTRWVDARGVTAFRALEKYTAFDLAGEQVLVRDSLDALEETLGLHGFVRVHRGALVRADAIAALAHEGESAVVRLTDGTTVAVSRRQLAGLKLRLGLRRA